MNSSLLVPAFLGVAIATVVGVFFGESLFSGDSSTEDNSYTVSQAVQSNDATVAVNATPSVDDFSWDDQPATPGVDSLTDLGEVATKAESAASKDELAPGDLFDVPVQRSVAPGVAEVEPMSDIKTEAVNSGLDLKTAETQVSSDLNDFFNTPSPVRETSNNVERSPLRSQAKKEPVDWNEAPSLDVLSQSPKSESKDVGQAVTSKARETAPPEFDTSPVNAAKSESMNFAGLDSSDFGNNADNDSVKKSVVTSTPNDDSLLPDFNVATTQPGVEKSVVKGSLEPIVDDLEAVSTATPEMVVEKALVRKFKITNPKETTLPVTMSVNGEHVTLQPDQTYVINDKRGEVNVTFSRGGSFGFKSQKITTGHYRFSVSRDSGWKLSN